MSPLEAALREDFPRMNPKTSCVERLLPMQAVGVYFTEMGHWAIPLYIFAPMPAPLGPKSQADSRFRLNSPTTVYFRPRPKSDAQPARSPFAEGGIWVGWPSSLGSILCRLPMNANDGLKPFEME